MTRSAPAKQRGVVLIASLMLVVFVSLAVLGLTVFIVQRLAQSVSEQIYTRAIYLAQAGIQQAVYFFRYRDLAANGYFSLGRTNIDGENFFVLGAADADLLMVNTASAALGGGGSNHELVNLTLQNATNSRQITLGRMVISWNNSRRLQRIRIANTTVWTGDANSPANANITDFTLDSVPTIYPVDYLRFNGSMAGATITIQFIMTGGSSRTIRVYPASQNYNFTLKATGKTSASGIYRTVQAEYNALTAKIVDYEEINSEITP